MGRPFRLVEEPGVGLLGAHAHQHEDDVVDRPGDQVQRRDDVQDHDYEKDYAERVVVAHGSAPFLFAYWPYACLSSLASWEALFAATAAAVNPARR